MNAPSLVCPDDRTVLLATEEGLLCQTCARRFTRNRQGYYVLGRPNASELTQDTTTDEHAAGQAGNARRLYDQFLKDWVGSVAAMDVLDAGCGLGLDVQFMLEDGLNAYGIDLPGVSRLWQERGYSPDHFVCGGVLALPFPDASFDAVISLGVVEHIGTTTGHCTLGAAWRQERAAFARELLRVVRPGGHLLLACPNKWFPVDLQHGVYDGVTRVPVREAIYNRTGLNVHRTWGEYHLPSYADMALWFSEYEWRALPLSGYFGFGFLERRDASPLIRRMATGAIDVFDRLPSFVRKTPINPYILIDVTR